MSIIIREGDINADGERISRALKDYLTPLADRPRFDWLYKHNPAGRVRVWLALDANEQLIGTAAAFPRALCISGQQRPGWVLGDFCVSDRHRSLGPAVALQRAVLEGADSAGIVSYDFPSVAMTAVYKRLKIEPASRLIRLTKMLRVDRKVREQVVNEALANALSSLGNIFLRATAGRPAADPCIGISLLETRCGPEFDDLVDRMAARFGACVQRSSDYLNWRYLDDPCKKHQVMRARRDGALLGYVVFSENAPDGEIVDIFGEDDESVIGRLIDEVVELFRQRGAINVSAALIESHRWTELFKKHGFYPRESKPFMVYTPNGISPLATNGASASRSWFITGGDRDS